MFLAWLKAFVFTQIIEVPIYARILSRRYSWPHSFFYAFLASTITHPVVWFVVPVFFPLSSYTCYFVVAEIFAVLTEALYFKMLSIDRAFIIAFLVNALSAGCGILWWWLKGWIL